MRKWIKRLILLALLFLLGISALLYGGFRLFRGAPQWYRRSTISIAQREVLASRAFNKITEIQNAAALARRNELAAHETDATTRPAPIDVSFSDDELNAFFDKWASYANWKSNYDRYVEDPLIVIQNDHLILAGQVKEMDAVISLEFDPRIDAQGMLNLNLIHIGAGRLQLPEIIVRHYRENLTAALRTNLPRWRHGAAIDPNGAANSDLISVAIARLFIHVLDHEPADPVLFLPLVERHANVPVRVCSVKVEDHTVTMTVLPLNANERAALLARIRAEE